MNLLTTSARGKSNAEALGFDHQSDVDVPKNSEASDVSRIFHHITNTMITKNVIYNKQASSPTKGGS